MLRKRTFDYIILIYLILILFTDSISHFCNRIYYSSIFLNRYEIIVYVEVFYVYTKSINLAIFTYLLTAKIFVRSRYKKLKANTNTTQNRSAFDNKYLKPILKPKQNEKV